MENIQKQVSAVKSVEYELEAITPVTIHGADTGQSEARLASIKGMTRYWYRVLGSDTDTKAMQEKERAVFGSAQGTSLKSKIWFTEKAFSARNGTFRPSHSKTFTVNAFSEGTKWRIAVSSKKSEEANLVFGAAAFEGAVLLGGFGQRGRHGASSFKFTDRILDTPAEYLRKIEQIAQILGTETEVDEKKLRIKRRHSLPGQPQRPYWLETTLLVTGLKSSTKEILAIIREATHDCHTKFEGALGAMNPRFPAPLHTSLYAFSDGYAVIISEIHHEKSQSQRFLDAKHQYEQTIKEGLHKMR